ncbi:MAG TPA: Ldh family oxidoreductase [Candidatus Deferrimicrobium sp.]|nr:Ldh family oxidoreductase [Candidatus Deferrimicrobium sp.]
MPPFDVPADGFLIDHVTLRDWTKRVVCETGTAADMADDVADVLVAADLRGITSHGTGRLSMYVALVEAGITDAHERPERIGGMPAMGLWDGRNGWGPHAGRVVMDDVIERARTLGIAAAVIRHANHYGIAGWYAIRAADRGLIGMTMTNGTPLVAPTRGRTKLLGTNPIAFAAPAGRYGNLVLDMATSAVTWGRLLVDARRGHDLADGVGMDSEGRVTTSPAAVLADGALIPLGGSEATAGYKGYGLALMVDALTGVLAGANFGPFVEPFSLAGGPSDLGQMFLAIDPNAIDPGGFVPRLEALIDELVGAPTAPGAAGPVLYPGQPESEREAEQREHGIVLDGGHHDLLAKLGERLGLPFPAVKLAAAGVPHAD